MSPGLRRGLHGTLIVSLAAWGLIATVAAVEKNKSTDELRVAYDDKVRSLTRRLVGVASHEAIDADNYRECRDQLDGIIARGRYP